ncbi:hypothetical protein [Hyphomonas sp.]|jgi:hypothetical protein|tara:strand:- start:465 stop:797 length:333 start_codon:yes stop_codon:yes gene_type:complete
MEQYCFIIITVGPDEEDDDYRAWYECQHMPDVLDVPGFVSAQRFRLQEEPENMRRYLTLFEIETDDIEKSMRTLRQRAGTSLMPLMKGAGQQTAQRMVGRAVMPKLTNTP